GRFWTLGSGLRTDVSAAHFADDPPKGYALAGWNFTVRLLRDGTSELRTETRVRCAADVRAKFRAYWFIIRPGSALIRRDFLRTETAWLVDHLGAVVSILSTKTAKSRG